MEFLSYFVSVMITTVMMCVYKLYNTSTVYKESSILDNLFISSLLSVSAFMSCCFGDIWYVESVFSVCNYRK